MAHGTTNAAMVTIGLDLGDRQTAGCVVDAGGQILERFQARTTPTRLLAAVTRWPGARVVLEVGGQSPWVSRRLQAAGYGVVVANARRVRLIAEGDAKSDRLDAELLARLGRVDPALLAPIQHRSERTQRDLGVVKTRAALVRMRTLGINHGRGVAKALGHRLPACAAEAFPARVRAQAVGATLPGIIELLAVLEQLTASIRALDRQLATLATTRYPVTELLRQVPGVGPLTALTYVLTLEDPTRFPRSRTVGAYLGLRPKRRDSGAQQPELSITKAGDVLLRRHLLAIYGNLIIDTSVDDHVFALDATTGDTVWDTEILDYTTHPALQGSGPIVANGKVISGRSCMELGGPDACVITAHDARTGAELWRRRTIPGPGEPGDETWGHVAYEDRKHVGTWMVPSYDPELNLIYIGTSVTSPAPKFMLGGTDNKHLYHNSTLAIDADSGEIVWYYQHLIDHWDLDHPFERLLVDTLVAPDPAAVDWINPRLRPGETRKVVTGIPGKTGVVYTLDRETGEILWATPTVAQNVITHIDGATGAVTENSEVVFSGLGQEVLSCPSWIGGKDWEAGAYSPLTNTMFYPLRNTCARVLSTMDGGLAIYRLAARFQLAPGTDQLGTVRAISVETGRTAWVHEQRAATMSLVTTGGGLVFGGDVNGRFRAFDQETGEVLWEINIGSPVTGFPISFAVDGRQYVAVSTGSAATASGFMALTPELRPSAGNTLFVFALPDRN